MIDNRTASYAALLLRIVLGLFFLIHAGQKIFVYTPAGTAQYFASLGLPAALASAVIFWETVIGLALEFGVWPRLAALIIIPDLIGTIVSVHGTAGFFFNNPNGGWEFPALWIVALLALFLIGDGPYAVVQTPGLDRASTAPSR